jgi:hypothetical protein
MGAFSIYISLFQTNLHILGPTFQLRGKVCKELPSTLLAVNILMLLWENLCLHRILTLEAPNHFPQPKEGPKSPIHVLHGAKIYNESANP